MIEARLGSGQHQPHPVAVEEGEAWRRRKQEGQAEGVAVEAHRALHVMRSHRYLVDA